MKNFLLILFVLLITSCTKQNKYGVNEGLFTYPYFKKEKVKKTIVKAIGCDFCIEDIQYPTGYPIGTPRLLQYIVIYNSNGASQIKSFYIGKVLTMSEELDNNYLRLIEDSEPYQSQEERLVKLMFIK